MDRRAFLRTSFSAGAAAVSLGTVISSGQDRPKTPGKNEFKLKYAPHFGMFRHHAGEDLIDQLQFIAEQGFAAFEDIGMMSRPKDTQEKISRKMSSLGITMGTFFIDNVGKNFVSNSKPDKDTLIKNMKAVVEVANRVNARWCVVVPGEYDPGMERAYQTTNVIEKLKWCAEVCEPSGLVMVLEPLNPWREHPGLFLTKIPQAYQICKAVGSPSCKVLNDLYHQQITEGNLIPNIDAAWSEIAYFHIGDNPGRCEPTTGEINYKNVFRHIYNKGFKGVLGMEHGNSRPGKEGEMAVIEAYRYCDSF